ncbi:MULTISPECIES: CaiB/BaiF CoA transferase family protein [Bradyrhizobium]|uniref:CoA transferase n=1 Tax=Bradyrhizobium canariense TaxID=255045 RepID=A0A1X3GT14_9BRAD|nr:MULTISPECIES: CoA transferase [Bradyrhizobium]OSI71589.1 CoA transferase [Bradyrhizobium canariense]OSI80552.1 CoA transferase [Bradyrhizobium canariense]OSI91154.1 CoA transferase [Bradyrhizobium canariense]OSI96903.1 CoA transferase [Bradyrhizobium canariense]OSJ09205.1 CoA transferase [Bradyrhizobium canariense]
MSAPLEGLHVVDFTRVLAGPHCTKALRDLGADVTKIEPPSGDLGRVGLPHVDGLGMYYVQQNAGKRNLSIDLNYAEAREIVVAMCREADVIVENFRPGTLARFGLGYEDVSAHNPGVVYVSMSGYGQSTSWRNRPAFAPTVQAETGLTAIVQDHFGEALSEPRGDACSHADVYTGLQGVIAVLAALQHRNRTGEGQHVDVSMAATMLSVNERAGAQLSGIDTDGEPIALSANESHIFEMSDGTCLTIAGSPIYSPMFTRYCAMMRRNDLVRDPRFATANLRRKNLVSLLAEIRAWLATFDNLEQLQAQISEAGLAVGRVRTINQFADSEWVKEWNAVVEVDDRAGGVVRMPGNPWIFSRSKLPSPGIPAFQGEHNQEILTERHVALDKIMDLQKRGVLLSRRGPFGDFD